MIGLLIILMATLAFAYIRVEALGRRFVIIQVLTGIPWIAYALWAWNQNGWTRRPDYPGILMMATFWMVHGVSALRKIHEPPALPLR